MPPQQVVGHAFLGALGVLGLEEFEGAEESERWLRYVTPMLIHGGIPAAVAAEAARTGAGERATR